MILLVLLLSLYGLLHLPSVQTWLVKKATDNLSKKLQTRVSIGSIDVAFFYKLRFNDLLIEDRQGDTVLYAGAAKVRVNDWFFIKDKITLQYAGLDDVVVNLHRTSETWNYEFLEDFFSSPSSKKSTGKNKTELDIKDIELNRIRFSYVDGWRGEDMLGSVKHLSTRIDSFGISDHHLDIRYLNLDEPYFLMRDYEGNRPADHHSTPSTTSNTTKQEPDNWLVAVNSIIINNGAYYNERSTERPAFTDQFDPLHFGFHSIQAKLEHSLLKDSVFSTDIRLSTREKNGFEVKSLRSNMTVTPEMMSFSNLEIRTPYSLLKDYYAMRYSDFHDDMNDFVNKVVLDGHLTGSHVSTEDISYFAPELSDWHTTFNIEAYAKGTLSKFEANNMNITGSHTHVEGSLKLRDMTNLEDLFINFESAGSSTNYKDLSFLVPELKQLDNPRLDKLGDIYFKGNFLGKIRDFVAKGTLNTGLGNIVSDIQITLPEKGKPTYSGNLTARSFNLGAFTNSSTIGSISLNGQLKGSGFDLASLNASFNGFIPQIQFNGYDYRNITANGNFRNKRFIGQLSVNDSNLQIRQLDGMMTLTGKEIAFSLDADLTHANFKNIGLTDKDLALKGHFNLNFTGNNIDNFLGEANISDATLTHDCEPMSFRSLSLQTLVENNRKTLRLRSNEAEGDISGQFKILELPDAFKLFLNRYFPTYIPKPAYQLSNQDFSFNIKTNNIDEYLGLFTGKISGLNDASISGSLNLSDNELVLQGSIPQIRYENKSFSNISINGKGSADTLTTDISVGETVLSDSIVLPDTKLLLISANDESEIHLKTSASSTLNNADLNARIQTLSDGVNIRFYPSSFILKDKKWLLDEGGNISIRKNLLMAEKLNLHHDEQYVSVTSSLDEVNSHSHVTATLDQVNLSDFLPYAFTNPAINGRLTGTLTVNDPLGAFKMDFKGKADSLELEDKYIGNINLEGEADGKTGAITYVAETADTVNIFKITGSYNFKDSGISSLRNRLEGKKIHLSILEPYLKSVFSQVDGMAIANLELSGPPNHPFLTGQVKVTNGTIKVDYTQCRYFLNNQTIRFENDQINLDMIQIRDSLNNTAAINGRIKHDFFDDFQFSNLRLETSKLALLQTTAKDNPLFYGNLIGRAQMNLSGPLNNLQLGIDGAPNEVDSSHIYLNTSDSKESSKIDYIDFVQFGSAMEEEKTSDKFNMVVSLKIKSNPACKVDVILDEETGDVIKGQGDGQLNIRVGNIEPLSIMGNYKLTRGEYTFNFQTFFKKPFILNRGTITWNGDPYNALIDIDADYLAKNVDISSLSSAGGIRQNEDIKIISHLTGILQKPTVTFDLELPEKSEAKRNEIVVKRLAEFKNDENEMNKQVASLLLFNTFIIGNQNFLSQGNASTLITNSIGGMVSNLLTNFFNRELEKATRGILSTYIDINPTLDLQKNASQLQANIRAGLKILLNKRLLMLVGGNLDYNNPSYAQQLEKKGLVTPDITIEWLINKDGSLRVVGFNRSSIDFTMSQRNRSGLQLSYRKDVNRISDIFKSRKRLSQEDSSVRSPAQKPEED